MKEYYHLTCNYEDCYIQLTDTAYVTSCSHIFCDDHGEEMKTNFSKRCLACKEPLSDDQIMQTNLNIKTDRAKLLLAGHDPHTINEIANSALGFWNYQKEYQSVDTKRILDHYRSTFQHQFKLLEEMKLEIRKLTQENEDLTRETVLSGLHVNILEMCMNEGK